MPPRPGREAAVEEFRFGAGGRQCHRVRSAQLGKLARKLRLCPLLRLRVLNSETLHVSVRQVFIHLLQDLNEGLMAPFGVLPPDPDALALGVELGEDGLAAFVGVEVPVQEGRMHQLIALLDQGFELGLPHLVGRSFGGGDAKANGKPFGGARCRPVPPGGPSGSLS